MKCSQGRNSLAGRYGVMNQHKPRNFEESPDKPHDFGESLAQSHAAEDLPIWKEVYQKAFPNMITMINHRQNGEHQRAGIDRSIILENSKQLLIDEKVRGKNKKTGKIYRDIALEYWSDFDRHTLGWVCKPLRADYIAYAIAPLGICYLLPVLQLQKAWKENGEAWIEIYKPPIVAENEYKGHYWKTISVGVPVKVLFKAMGQCLRISFQPTDLEDLEKNQENKLINKQGGLFRKE